MDIMIGYLDDKEARLMIFSFCLKTRNDRRHLFDIEVNHLISSILEQCSYSTSEWEKVLDQLSLEKKKKKLQTYDHIIESYIYNPSQLPSKINSDPELEDADYIRFILFNALHESDMRPIQFENDDTFKFSDAWTIFLKDQNSYKLTFVIEAQTIENSLRNPQKKLGCYIGEEEEIPNIPSFSPSLLEMTIKECLQSLLHCYPSAIPSITFCLLSLLQLAKKSCTEQVYHEYISMSRAVWLKIFQSLLDDVVFENPETTPFKKSRTISKLSKYCSCLAQYNRFTRYELSDDFDNYLDNMWYHFLCSRRIYLKSTNTTDQDLVWLETLLF
ncbi:hypothetical protein BD770DRAFT_76563 [Pilaira anomala]|nr:hypothetical protein BD770DRAFT_76563 [Pilaira anomala]